MDKLAQQVISALRDRNLTLATAESCTGGGVGQRLTSVSGSSAVYRGGIISYCNEIKHRLLGVEESALEELGAVSDVVAMQMAQGARNVLQTDLAVSVTGLAGPNSDESGKPVGLVYIGVATAGFVHAWEYHFSGDREAVRNQAADAALAQILANFPHGQNIKKA